jgi:hypothetical protein
MDDTKRLELISEAVRYCQGVKALGMLSSCYSKAARYRSRAAVTYEHRVHDSNLERAAEYRSTMKDRVQVWREVTRVGPVRFESLVRLRSSASVARSLSCTATEIRSLSRWTFPGFAVGGPGYLGQAPAHPFTTRVERFP